MKIILYITMNISKKIEDSVMDLPTYLIAPGNFSAIVLTKTKPACVILGAGILEALIY